MGTLVIPAHLAAFGAHLQVTGSFPIAYAAYGIPNPSLGGFVSVGNSGTIESLLILAKG